MGTDMGCRALALLVVAVFSASCFRPDDVVPLRGAIASTGTLVGQRIEILRDVSNRHRRTCAWGELFRDTATTADGGFSFDLPRTDMQAIGEREVCLRAQTTFASGASAWVDLHGISGPTELATLRDWASTPTRIARGVEVEAPGALERVEWLAFRVEVTVATGVIGWRQDFPVHVAALPEPNTRIPIPVVEHALDELDGFATVTVTLTETKREPVTLRLPTQLAVQPAQPPISRGLSCPEVASPCPLTDGALERVVLPTSEVTLVLPSPTPLSMVLLRGLSTSENVIRVEITRTSGPVARLSQALPTPQLEDVVRPDGDVETELSSLFVGIPIESGPPVMQVRLKLGSPSASVAEVSLY
jgi:hypothetical protein